MMSKVAGHRLIDGCSGVQPSRAIFPHNLGLPQLLFGFSDLLLFLLQCTLLVEVEILLHIFHCIGIWGVQAVYLQLRVECLDLILVCTCAKSSTFRSHVIISESNVHSYHRLLLRKRGDHIIL